MTFLLDHKRFFSFLLVVIFTSMTTGLPLAHAKMISTAQTLNSQTDLERARLSAFLERGDVQSQLEAWGLDKKTAQARVDGLTDEEVSQIAREMDRLPAGGDGLGIVIGAAVLIFLVLLLTDIAGYTDVFPFVKKHP